jgi:hypothetical protein
LKSSCTFDPTKQSKTKKDMTTSIQTLTFGQLQIGSVINYRNDIYDDNINYVVLSQYQDKWGSYTLVLNMETLEKDEFAQHTPIHLRWSLVKEG